MDHAPDDFRVCYTWREGSMPPPHHYEFTVTVSSGGEGVVAFWPDYPEFGQASAGQNPFSRGACTACFFLPGTAPREQKKKNTRRKSAAADR